MPFYDVKLEMQVQKTYRLEAETEDEAIELAHERASVLAEDGVPEHYDQETVSCTEVEPPTTIHVEADYYTTSMTAVDLPFPWSEVDTTYVKWNALAVITKDNVTHWFKLFDPEDVDLKWPAQVRIWEDNNGSPDHALETLAEY